MASTLKQRASLAVLRVRVRLVRAKGIVQLAWGIGALVHAFHREVWGDFRTGAARIWRGGGP